MAKASLQNIMALKKVAQNLRNDARYEWGHMGLCNCGNLAQILTPFNASEIHQWAVAAREGDWNDMLNHYCPATQMPIDLVITTMLNSGFTTEDLKHLEKLSDPVILESMGVSNLDKNSRSSVIPYLETWALLLENELKKDNHDNERFSSQEKEYTLESLLV